MPVPGPVLRRQRSPRGSGEQLREEILDAATELLLATGDSKAVSIRSVAQRVGVTPPSIYLHFADKDALLSAVTARYYEQLDEHLQQARAGQPTTLDVFLAQGLAYVRFATQTPEMYRIAAMVEGNAAGDVDAVLASSAFVHMLGTVRELMSQGIFAEGDPTTVALDLWAAVHGVAALLIAKPYLPFGDREAFAERVLKAACTGQVVAGLVGVDATPAETVHWLFQPRREP